MRSHRTFLAALAVAALSPLVVAPSASADHGSLTIPKVSGETVIHASGMTGIVMEFERPVRWFRDHISIEASPDTHDVFVGLRLQSQPRDWCDFCFRGSVSWSPNSPFADVPFATRCTDDAGNEVGCQLQEGPVEIYLISDGELTFTMRFPELDGSVEVEATGQVDGIHERLPVSCEPLGQCSRFAHGGAAHEIGLEGRPAFAGVTAWTWVDSGLVSPGENKVVSCAYPGYFSPEKSPNPDDHPYGCDVDDPLDQSFNFLVPSVNLNGGGWQWSEASFKTHGLQYLGFTTRQTGTIHPTRFDAWGLWLNQGITCPSDDFFDCNKPHE